MRSVMSWGAPALVAATIWAGLAGSGALQASAEDRAGAGTEATAAGAAQAGDATAGDAVKAADLARFKALTSHDIDALAGMLGDDLTYVHSSAASDTKATYLANLRAGKARYHTIEPSNVQARVYGSTVILTGEAKVSVTSSGELRNMVLRYTDVWVQRDGGWKMVAWQSTRLP